MLKEQLTRVATLVRQVRRDRHWSVYDLSKVAGRDSQGKPRISPPYIYQIEAFADGRRRRKPPKPVRLSLEALRALARALDLDIYQLLALTGHERRSREGLVKQSLDYIQRMREELQHLETAYWSMAPVETIQLHLPAHLSSKPLLMHRGDHVLLFIASENDREIALDILRYFAEQSAASEDPTTAEGCAFLARDLKLKETLKHLNPLVVDPKTWPPPVRGSVPTPQDRLLYFPWGFTQRQHSHAVPFSADIPKAVFQSVFTYYKERSVTFSRYVLEDTDKYLELLGSGVHPEAAANQQRLFLQYEHSWAEDMRRWAYNTKPPVLICQYFGDRLRSISSDALPLSEIILTLLQAHDDVWLVRPGAAVADTEIVATHRAAARWILENCVLSGAEVRSESFWSDLHLVGTRYRLWTHEGPSEG